MSESKPCGDCDGSMKPIRMIDQQLSQHHPIVYSVLESTRSFWSSKYPIEGTVEAIMCDSCGLIKLYGRPSADE